MLQYPHDAAALQTGTRSLRSTCGFLAKDTKSGSRSQEFSYRTRGLPYGAGWNQDEKFTSR